MRRWTSFSVMVAGVLAGCQAAGPSLELTVVSDLRAGTEVTRVRAELSDAPFEGGEGFVREAVIDLALDDDLAAGVEIPELPAGLAPIQHLRVSLLDASGRARAQRIATVPIRAMRAITLTLARSCAGVLCPGEGDGDEATSCVNGACVEPSCHDEASCDASVLCASDADCGGASACQRAVCSAGECLLLDACGAGEVCVADACEPAPRCGDGICDAGSETACACEEDCGPCAASCGDGLCDPSESGEACPEDCGPPDAVCGDRVCDVELESVVSCPDDCAARAPAAVCGDDRCEGTESCDVCPECCEDRGCGDGVCDAMESPCGCEVDCGACMECGDGRCDAGESCPDDCADAPVCGDGVCAAEIESCASCEADCGWCTGYPALAPEPTCVGDPTRDEDVCEGIAGAYTNAAVNLAYYPMRVASFEGTDVITGDTWDGGAGRVIVHLDPDQRFAVQSTRNPGCVEAPPLRPARDGYVFGYVPGEPEAAMGWVLATDLVRDDRPGASPCAFGPSGTDFAIRVDPYARPAACEPVDCRTDEILRTCAQANPPGEGDADCGGRALDEERAVRAETLELRYAPAGPARRFLHAGDRVRVLYESGREGWVFVSVTTSAAPILTPIGSRGWVDASYLD